MGYAQGYNVMTGRLALACDNCGKSHGTTRKRTCTAKVTWHDGMRLPYCKAPALCPECFKALGGSKGLHAGCQEPAAACSAEQAAERARIESGDPMVQAAWGDWHAKVPEGQVLVSFSDAEFRLIPSGDYQQGGFLSDYPAAVLTDIRPF